MVIQEITRLILVVTIACLPHAEKCTPPQINVERPAIIKPTNPAMPICLYLPPDHPNAKQCLIVWFEGRPKPLIRKVTLPEAPCYMKYDRNGCLLLFSKSHFPGPLVMKPSIDGAMTSTPSTMRSPASSIENAMRDQDGLLTNIDVSADGSKMVFCSKKGIALFDMAANRVTELLPVRFQKYSPQTIRLSPDGKWVSFSIESKQSFHPGTEPYGDLWIASTDGKIQQRLGLGIGGVWSRDSSFLYSLTGYQREIGEKRLPGIRGWEFRQYKVSSGQMSIQLQRDNFGVYSIAPSCTSDKVVFLYEKEDTYGQPGLFEFMKSSRKTTLLTSLSGLINRPDEVDAVRIAW